MSKRVDVLNIGLIFVSLILAFIIPFRLFLFGYAVLGPLHYLTEINWLRDKDYFVRKRKVWVWVPILFAVFILLPKVLLVPPGNILVNGTAAESIVQVIEQYNNGFIFIWLVVSAGLILTNDRKQLLGVTIIAVLLGVFLNSIPVYNTIIGVFVPTVGHVYLFTMLFMLYGAMKTRSRPGYMGVALHALCPILIATILVNPEAYNLTQGIRDTFVAGQFYQTNAAFGKLMGFTDGTQFSFEAMIDIRIQIFMAFAYIYHYLNWFSKTTVIGWHRTLTTRRSLFIAFFWVMSIAVYWYDYSAGLLALLALSMLHVLLEFPLNILSVKGIIKGIKTA